MSATPATLRRINRRRIFARLWRNGPSSRAMLARELDISPPTTSKIVDQLIAEGLLQPCEPPARDDACSDGESVQPGRPAGYLSVERDRPRIGAVQLGVRHTRLAFLPLIGPRDEHWPEAFDTPRDMNRWIKQIAMRLKAGAASGPEVIVVSVPGVVDEQRGRVLFSPNLHDSESLNLRDRLTEATGLPTILVQEIRALALGHRLMFPGDDDFLLVDIGEGVGAAMMMDGRLFQGPGSLSGEIGHVPISGNARPCGCGRDGCLETLLGREGLIRSAREAQRGSRRQRAVEDHDIWRALGESIGRGALPAWLDRTLAHAGRVIATALNLTGQDRVIITGALAELGGGLEARLSRHINAMAMLGRFGNVRVSLAVRYRAAGLVAAAIERHWFAQSQTDADSVTASGQGIDHP
ncbi:MAG: ROK family transcriptional regulator [Phycisphaeraceae bacterium]|nr:ROK family transcriptional regulator [Phycisphaeraceae bacterium]